MIPLIIGGPTAVGKSDVACCVAKKLNACCVAKKLNGEIISADSMAVYRFMDVGTAKPLECMKEVKHHLIDVVEPSDYFDAKMFEERAKKLLKEIQERGRVPLVVGGTYLYIQALLYGIDETPEPNWKLRNASKIHKNDVRRIVRALEVFITSGRPFSSFHTWDKPKLEHVGIFLIRSRENLFRRIEDRLKIVPCAKGEKPVEECLKEAIRNTKEQARRQIRWFRQRGWYEINLDRTTMEEACEKIVKIYRKRT